MPLLLPDSSRPPGFTDRSATRRRKNVAWAKRPRVSIVIIFFNERAYLAEAAESVFAQTFDEWELILADDGSTDGSTAIAEDLVRRAPDRVKLVQHPGRENRGMSATRNLGIAAASGDMIGFLDGDDVWLPGKLEAQVAVFDREPETGMVYGRTLIWNRWDGGLPEPDFTYDLGIEAGRTYAPPTLFRVLLANKAQTPTTCNALMRRALVEQVGGFEPSFRGMFEDQVFFAKVLLQAQTHVSDAVWAKYRQHRSSHSSMSGRDGSVHLSRKRFLFWLRDYTRRSGAEPEERRLIDRQIAEERWDHAKWQIRSLMGSAQ